MRTLLYRTLMEAWEGNADIDKDGVRLYASGSLGSEGVPAVPPKPFGLIREMPSTRIREVREFSQVQRQTFQLYIYDLRGSYVRIDRLLDIAKGAVDAMEGQHSPTGAFCMGSLWVSVSQDYTDDQYDAVVRYAIIQTTANK